MPYSAVSADDSGACCFDIARRYTSLATQLYSVLMLLRQSHRQSVTSN